MKPLTADGRLGEYTRRLRISDDDVLDAVTASAGWWQQLARRDEDAATGLAIELAATRRLAICDDRPHRYIVERRVVLDHPDHGVRAELLRFLDKLWDTVPYCGSTRARSVELRKRDKPAAMIEFADLLGEVPMRSLRTSALPAELVRVGDADRVDTIHVAERTDKMEDEALAKLEISWLPTELQRLAPSTNRALFLRELFGLHSSAVALLVCYSKRHPRRHATGTTLIAAMHQLNRLVEVAGKADSDPLYGLEIVPSEIVLSAADIIDFETAVEADYYLAVDRARPSMSPKAIGAAAAKCTAGLNPLLDVLEAGRDGGAHIALLPSIRLGTGRGRTRTYGYVPDGYFPEPGELAEVIALGIDELSAPEDELLLVAFLTAIITLCRPKECLPRAEDVAPLGNVHRMVLVDSGTGKTGARELYVPASAVRIFGFSAKWLASRRWVDPHPLELLRLSRVRRRRSRWHKVLPTNETDRARETLEEACRRVRARYEQETGRNLVDRLAYVTRKLLAAYLWRAPIRPADVLADVLGHGDSSGDDAYTDPTESEVLDQNTTLIAAARQDGDAL